MRLFSLYTTLARERDTFARFSVIGGLGFLADAGVLELLIAMTNLGPLLARIGSFAIAVLVTFALNRYWTFSGSQRRPWAQAFLAYLTVQSVGFAANLAVYSFMILVLPPPLGQPVIALAAASAFALTLNYIGARDFVFAAPRALKRPGAPRSRGLD
jgi:putative flippase GtrA